MNAVKNAVRAEDAAGEFGDCGENLREGADAANALPASRFAASCRLARARLDQSLPLLTSNRHIAIVRGLPELSNYYRLLQFAALWQYDLTVLACELDAAPEGWKKTLFARLACRMAQQFTAETTRLYETESPRLLPLLLPDAATRRHLAKATQDFARLAAQEAGFLFGVMAGETAADAGERLWALAALDTGRVLALMTALCGQAAELEKVTGALWREALGGPSAAQVRAARRKEGA